jgi:hypothetical protein
MEGEDRFAGGDLDVLRPLPRKQLVDGSVETLVEVSSVRHNARIDIRPETSVAFNRGHTDRKPVSFGDRHHGIRRLEATAAHVKGHVRPRDVRDGQIERQWACRGEPHTRLAKRARDVGQRVDRFPDDMVVAGLLPLTHQPVETVKPMNGARLIAGQIDEYCRDLVPELALSVRPTNTRRDHRLQGRRLLPTREHQIAHGPCAYGQKDVVQGNPVPLFDPM